MAQASRPLYQAQWLLPGALIMLLSFSRRSYQVFDPFPVPFLILLLRPVFFPLAC